MIPDEKLFEIIKYAGKQGFNINIIGNFKTVEIVMCDSERIVYERMAPEIKIIKKFEEHHEESAAELSLMWLADEVRYYQEMLKIANMLQDSIEGNETIEDIEIVHGGVRCNIKDIFTVVD